MPMGLFDRAEIQRIAEAEDATASQVHRAALAYGLPELRKALEHERVHGGPWQDPSGGVPVLPGVPVLEQHADVAAEAPEVEAAVP